jgi:hypothetical protein
MSDLMHERSRGRKGRVRVHDSCVPPVPSFHRWLLALGIFLLLTWLPYQLGAQLAELHNPRISQAPEMLPVIYTLGFWFTVIGIVFEIGYCCVGGYVSRVNDDEQLLDLSGRRRFSRGKKKYKYKCCHGSLEPEELAAASADPVQE